MQEARPDPTISLGENVLLISLNHSLKALAEIIPILLGLSYKYIIFHEGLEWHEVTSKD